MAGGSRNWAYVGGVVLSAAVGVAAGVWYDIGQVTGDEPPIRVKNGSMHLDLDSGGWTQDATCTERGGGKCWTPNTGESEGVFGVVITPMPDGCRPPTGAVVDRVTVGYSDETKVSLKVGAKKGGSAKRWRTKVRPHGKLTLEENGRRLSYGTPGKAGVVKWIELDGEDAQGAPDRWRCEFTESAPLVEACFTSTGDAAKCRR